MEKIKKPCKYLIYKAYKKTSATPRGSNSNHLMANLKEINRLRSLF